MPYCNVLILIGRPHSTNSSFSLSARGFGTSGRSPCSERSISLPATARADTTPSAAHGCGARTAWHGQRAGCCREVLGRGHCGGAPVAVRGTCGKKRLESFSDRLPFCSFFLGGGGVKVIWNNCWNVDVDGCFFGKSTRFVVSSTRSRVVLAS